MKTTGGGYPGKVVSPQEPSSDIVVQAKSSKPPTVRDEMLHRAHRFLGVVTSTLQQLRAQGVLFFFIICFQTRQEHVICNEFDIQSYSLPVLPTISEHFAYIDWLMIDWTILQQSADTPTSKELWSLRWTDHPLHCRWDETGDPWARPGARGRRVAFWPRDEGEVGTVRDELADKDYHCYWGATDQEATGMNPPLHRGLGSRHVW